jgi:tetratricopeptide (TPR) repeat protein/DNA-binding transcriptional ArsR family regulator
MSPETLEQIFVQREDIAQDLVDRIILSATTPAKHHSLLIGARGLGKTHLVSLVYYRLDRHQELKDKLMVAWLREDEWGIDSWLDLVVRIFRSLEETKGDTKGLLAQLQEVSISEAETLATQLLTELIGQKTLLLIVENLDDMFAGLGEKGQQKFRSFLQEHQCCTILATTPALFAGVQDLDEPFFELFNQIPLSPLSWEEATVMLQKIADLDGQADLANFLQTPAGKARVRAVHHLAGGNPRVYTLFAQFITRESLDELVQAFMKMLDDLTPYYQSRMKELSNQQRKIVEFLVDRREAVMVKEIATQCFIEQRVVSGQLLQLRNKGYVVARANGRESFYELTEVLMRLCMEVKKYRGQWVELFVDFLRIWYRPSERKDRLKMLRGNGGLVSDEQLEFALTSDVDPVLLIVSREFQNYLAQKNRILALQVLSELQSIGGVGEDRYHQIRELINTGKFDTAKMILDRAVEPDSNNAQELFSQGIMLLTAEKSSEALIAFDQTIKIDSKNANAFYFQGYTLDKLGKYYQAISSYRYALQLNPDYPEAWYRLGILLGNQREYEEAISSFDRALKLKLYYPEAWHSRGIFLGNLGRYEEAIASFDHAFQLKPDYPEAWHNRGTLLHNLSRYEEALSSYDRALQLKPDNYETWNNKGICLRILCRYEESMHSYDRAIKLKPNYSQAWQNQGILLHKRMGGQTISFDRVPVGFESQSYSRWYEKGNAAITSQKFDVAEFIEEFIEKLIEDLILKFTQPAVKNMLTELVQTYIQASVLTELGTALVRTLKQILAPDISDYTAQQWLALWQELLGDRPEMQLPFRLMTTAIMYKQHPERKERLWLGLASEERSILDEALE